MTKADVQKNIITYLTLADLQGNLAKTLSIPTGYYGVALNGEGHVYAAGKHKVVTLGQRLFGNASDRRWALLPATPFAVRVPIPRLRAGDGTWVDVDIMLTLNAEQPARAAATCPPTFTSLATALSEALEPAARQTVAGWGGDDLARPEVNGRLAAQLRPLLEAQAQTLGLRVERLLSVAARRSEEAVEAAHQRDALEVEKQMNALSTRAEWLDFVRAFKADFGLDASTLDALLADSAEGEFDAGRLRQAIAAALAGEEAALTVRTERILGKPEPIPPPPPPWWEQAIPWLKLAAGLLLFTGLALYALSPVLALEGAGLWLAIAAPVALALLAGAFWAEQHAAVGHRVKVVQRPLLERLGKGDRQRMDRLVREQLARELAVVRDKINDVRTQAYGKGLREQALELKSVETRADTLRQVAEAQGYGPAAYLTGAVISRQQLAAMLCYDEELLAHSAEVGDQAEGLRQAALSGDEFTAAAQQLEKALSTLDHQFQARARFIQEGE